MKNKLTCRSCKILVSLGLIISFNLNAAIIEYDMTLQLDNSQIRSNSWSPIIQYLAPTSISINDTFRFNINFSSNQALRWTDTGTSPEYASFTFLTQPRGTQVDVNTDVLISFLNPTGDYVASEFQNSSNSSGGGIGGTTLGSGYTNLTNSYFDITGLTFEISGMSNRGSLPTGLPAIFSGLSIGLVGGQFSIQSVPLPATGLLFLGGVLPLLGLRRYSKKSRGRN